MKKRTCTKLVLPILYAAIILSAVYAFPKTALAEFEGSVSAQHVVLMEMESGAILFEKNADAHAYPASTTKVMTCILVLEHGNLDDIVTVGSVTSSGSTVIPALRKGEKLSLRSLLYGMMLVSGNDAAEAAATHIAGSKSAFVEMMNDKARELGMVNTSFVEPSGLQKEEHFTTARDMAVLTRYALMESPKKDDFRAIIKRETYSIDDSTRKHDLLENTNKLIHTTEKEAAKGKNFEYRDAIGVKTGSTPSALRCLVAAAERGGVTLIAVIFRDEPDDTRFTLAAELFNWGFENFATANAETLGLQDTVQVPVKNYSFDDDIDKDGGLLTLRIDLSGKRISKDKQTINEIKANPGDIITKVITNGDVTAPIEEGALLATVAYSYKGTVLFQADAYASRGVIAMGAQATPSPALPNILPAKNGEGDSGPWLFIILVLVCLLFIAGLVLFLRARGRRKKHGRRHFNIYRARRR